MPIFSYRTVLPKKKKRRKEKSCLATAPRKCFEEDDSAFLQPDTSVTPIARLGAFLECSWAGRICVLQNEVGVESEDSLSG